MVMLLGVGIVTSILRLSGPPLFNQSIRDLQQKGQLDGNSEVEEDLILQEFAEFWQVSLPLALGTGCIAAGGLSYWAARRITKPVSATAYALRQLSEGNFNVRLPESELPELNYLSMSLNRMASSLEGAEKGRYELISDMTHELRTPLTIIRGYLEELADSRIAPSLATYHQLINETRRLERLIHDLQELSKAQAGYLPLKLQPLSLQPLLHSLVERFIDQIPEDGPFLSLSDSDELPIVLADPDRTEQILVNLLGNAVQYTKEGSIHLKTSVEGDRVWIVLTDTGIGIREEDLPHVFDRFWRAEQAKVKRSNGTGIGLAITRSLVELQGGTIKVESHLGKGSTFQFSLPLFDQSNKV